MREQFKPDAVVGVILHKWWCNLQEFHATRSEFRRCKDSTSVHFVPSFHALCRELQPHLEREYDWQNRLALVAGILSQVKQVESDLPFARQIAGSNGSTAIVSEMRFRRLIDRDRDELYLPIVRVVRMLNGSANIYDLSRSLFYWGDPVRKQWAYEYFGSNS
jgi:CRISPR system Cascade subunit CasB